ncbi:MAG: cell surface protein [Verrucomicrobia bacterium]|jgi:YVTN family beta-propeller protein|nr:cell surface protein [Verrucomicrobiota bacterium]MBT7067913.1 cell surface protein [Verrucomicrobiota bacterium]MBT7702154.1 cell surface protein [Verrucomicrobiota bacterium]
MTKLRPILTVILTAVVATGAAADKTYVSPLALAADATGKTLYVAGHTAEKVMILDVATGKTEPVSVPGRPTGLALSKNGKELFVSVAGPAGGVHVFKAKGGKVRRSLPTGHTPMSPVLSPDGKTLYVCNQFTDDVSVINLKGDAKPVRIKVKRQPVAAAITPDGKQLFVVNLIPDGPANGAYVAAAVSVIDTASKTVTATLRLPNGSSSLRGICVSPDGKYVYVTHVLGRYHMPTTQVERGWMNTNAMTIIDVAKMNVFNTVLLDDTELGAANPWGVACTADGTYICVAHSGTHELSVIDQAALIENLKTVAQPDEVCNDLAFLVGIRRRLDLSGNGPRGLVMIGTTAYASEYFTDSVGVLDINPDASPRPQAKSLPLGPKVQEGVARKGERIFYDGKACFQQWQSCATCHPDTRVDGLNWDLLNDGMGNLKQVKSMLLSHKTPPAMVTGIRASAEVAVRAGLRFSHFSVHPETDAVAIDEYLKSLEVVPSPTLVDGKLSESAVRGKKLFFDEVSCGACHSKPFYTDLKSYDVGSKTGNDRTGVFDTPTLIECWRTAPYMHDGQYPDMKSLLTDGKHGAVKGDVNKLNEEQLNDLIEFVLSL